MSATDAKLVFFGIEVSDYRRDCDVLQIAMKCGSDVFNEYIDPTGPISERSTMGNHLTNHDGKLSRDGLLMSSHPLREVLRRLLEFLRNLDGRCILVTHQCRFGAISHLVRIMQKENLHNEFRKIVVGFADTLPMFRRIFPDQDHEQLIARPWLMDRSDRTELCRRTSRRRRCIEQNAVLLEKAALSHFTVRDFRSQIQQFDVKLEQRIDVELGAHSEIEDGGLSQLQNEEARKDEVPLVSRRVGSSLVFFRVEVSDYTKDCDILQIVMKCGAAKFNAYINPTKPIDEKLTEVHRLSNRDGRLYSDDSLVPSLPRRTVIRNFFEFLKNLGRPCILIAHGTCSTDASRLCKIIRDESLEDEFHPIVGFVDTYPMFRKKFPHKDADHLTLQSLGCETNVRLHHIWRDNESVARIAAQSEATALHHFDEGDFKIEINLQKGIQRFVARLKNRGAAEQRAELERRRKAAKLLRQQVEIRDRAEKKIKQMDRMQIHDREILRAERREKKETKRREKQLKIVGPAVSFDGEETTETQRGPTLPDHRLDSAEVKLVFFGIEFDGRIREGDILQIAMKCGSAVFNEYIDPIKPIAEETTEVNHLTSHNWHLYREGVLMPSRPRRIVLQRLLEFLKNLGKPCILIAHRFCKHLTSRLMQIMSEESLSDQFEAVLAGFADTFPMFQTKFPDKDPEELTLHRLGFESKVLWHRTWQDGRCVMRNAALLEAIVSHFFTANDFESSSERIIGNFEHRDYKVARKMEKEARKAARKIEVEARKAARKAEENAKETRKEKKATKKATRKAMKKRCREEVMKSFAHEVFITRPESKKQVNIVQTKEQYELNGTGKKKNKLASVISIWELFQKATWQAQCSETSNENLACSSTDQDEPSLIPKPSTNSQTPRKTAEPEQLCVPQIERTEKSDPERKTAEPEPLSEKVCAPETERAGKSDPKRKTAEPEQPSEGVCAPETKLAGKSEPKRGTDELAQPTEQLRAPETKVAEKSDLKQKTAEPEQPTERLCAPKIDREKKMKLKRKTAEPEQPTERLCAPKIKRETKSEPKRGTDELEQPTEQLRAPETKVAEKSDLKQKTAEPEQRTEQLCAPKIKREKKMKPKRKTAEPEQPTEQLRAPETKVAEKSDLKEKTAEPEQPIEQLCAPKIKREKKMNPKRRTAEPEQPTKQLCAPKTREAAKTRLKHEPKLVSDGMSASEFNLVFFGVETSDRKKDCDVLQIAMKCGGNVFNEYIDPSKPIDPGQSAENHLTVRDWHLYRDGKRMVSRPRNIVLQRLLVFLRNLGKPCIFVAHCCCSPSAGDLTRIILEESLHEEFAAIVAGYVDTLEMIKEKFPNRTREEVGLHRLGRETKMQWQRKWYDGRCVRHNAILMETVALHFFTSRDIVAQVGLQKDLQRFVKRLTTGKKLEMEAAKARKEMKLLQEENMNQEGAQRRAESVIKHSGEDVKMTRFAGQNENDEMSEAMEQPRIEKKLPGKIERVNTRRGNQTILREIKVPKRVQPERLPEIHAEDEPDLRDEISCLYSLTL